MSCSKSRTCGSPTIRTAGSASRWTRRSTSTIPIAGRSIGWRHEIEKLDRDDALAFYRRFYTPNNAIVVVAGDVTPEEVKADAEETYGKVAPRAEIGPRERPTEPVQEAPRTVTLADPARRATER